MKHYYTVTVTETQTQTIIVEAYNEEDAERRAVEIAEDDCEFFRNCNSIETDAFCRGEVCYDERIRLGDFYPAQDKDG